MQSFPVRQLTLPYLCNTLVPKMSDDQVTLLYDNGAKAARQTVVLVGSTHCCVCLTSFKKVIAKDCLTPTQKWWCYVVNSASKKAHYQIIGCGGVKKRRDQYIVSWLNPADRLYSSCEVEFGSLISGRRQKNGNFGKKYC